MTQFLWRWVIGIGLAVVAVVLAVGTAGTGARAARPADSTITPTYFIHLPLVVRESGPTSTPTPTPTPTNTPTPTSTPCSTSNVSGTYLSQVSNLVNHGCPVSPPAPPQGEMIVIQDGTALTLRVGGDATGTIDPATGRFTVSAPLSPAAGCPAGLTCLNTTTGTFAIGQASMTFAGNGRVDISVFGSAFCHITYDIAGARTSCAPMAAP